MTEDRVVEVLRAVTRLVEDLARTDLATLDGRSAAGLHRQVAQVRDRLGLLAARLLVVVQDDGTWQGQGARSFPEWVARTDGTSMREARAQATLGQAVDDGLPATRDALADGAITLEHAQVIAQVVSSSPARQDAARSGSPDHGEAALVAAARRLGVDRFRTAARRWAHAVDAESAEREHAAAAAKEHLTLARRADGVALTGFLTHEHGAALRTALRAVAGVPSADDDRSAEQRQAAALADLSRLVLDRGLAGPGQSVRPHLSVHVPWATLEAVLADDERAAVLGGAAQDGTAQDGTALAPAELDDGQPIVRSALARLACDSEISRVVFGPEGDVLDVGRARRTYTGQQRRAVIARDRHCQFPRCTAPPVLGEVHHTTAWARGGRTSVSGGVLLCWFHHDVVHRLGIGITRAEGRWEFRRRDGSPLADLSADLARAA